MYRTYVVFACLIAREGGIFSFAPKGCVCWREGDYSREVILSDITQYKSCPVAGDDPNKQARNETSRVVSQQVRLGTILRVANKKTKGISFPWARKRRSERFFCLRRSGGLVL